MIKLIQILSLEVGHKWPQIKKHRGKKMKITVILDHLLLLIMLM